MIIIKTDKSTLSKVIEIEKHATQKKITCSPGDVILIQQNSSSLSKGEKSIKWVMDFVSQYEDQDGESLKFWGKKWKYIIQGRNVRKIPPFDPSDIQVTDKNYIGIQWMGYIDPEDEVEVLNWINDEEKVDVVDLTEKLENKKLNLDQYIEELNNRYKGTPKYKYVIAKKISRPSPLRDAIIKRDGTCCRICKVEGFPKKKVGFYCEVHHMIELNKAAPNSLQSWNVIIVCPTCHKKLHHGKTKTRYLNPGWEIKIDKETYAIN
ncbi:MAG TPA: HNH endonuclease [Chitinophagaceae bacterium]|nr:HNH endonuclease [Chitinophagaceae bacterium]